MLSWLRRYGAAVVASGVVLAMAALGPGCGSLGENSGANPSSGSGSSSGSSGVDSGSSSGGADAGGDGPDGGQPPAPTTALFVQGSPSLDARICWAKGGALANAPPFPGDGPMPASNYPGIPRGGAAAMADASGLTGAGVTLYAINALVLAQLDDGGTAQLPCDQLVCGPGTPHGTCLRYGLDYWPVPIDSGAIQASHDNVVAVGGCLPAVLDAKADVTRCGASWTPQDGNLHAVVLQLAPGASGPGALSVQAALLSPGLATLAQGPGDDGGSGDGGSSEAGAGDAGDVIDSGDTSDGGAGDAEAGSGGPTHVVVTFGPKGAADAGVVAALASNGDLQPPAAKTVSFDTGLAAFGTVGFSADLVYANGAPVPGAGHVWMSLAQAQELVDPTQDPVQFYGHAQTYLVALLGDPRAPQPFGGGTYDGTGLHLLVVTAPAPPPAAPPVDP